MAGGRGMIGGMTEAVTIDDDDVQRFGREGYLLPAGQLFSAERLAALSTIFAEHLEHKSDKLSDELDTPHHRDERLLSFLLDPTVLDVVEPIIGPDIMLWSSHFISKDPFTGRATPWHEDSSYWDGRLSRYDKIITIWLSLDGSDPENGCMRVIPGTHTNGFSDYTAVDRAENTFATEITGVDESAAVDFVLAPGEVSLHDGRIMHGATANRSPRRRTGYTMRYIAADVRIVPEANPGFRIWLARGQDRADNSYANA